MAHIKQAEATKVTKAGDRAPAPTPTKEEAPTPTKKDTAPKHLSNEAVETGAISATRPVVTKLNNDGAVLAEVWGTGAA